MVASHCAVDDVREPALEGSASFSGRLSFGDLAPVVVLPGSDVSDLARRDDVEHAVEGSVTASVQSMPGVVAAGGFQRCAAGVAGEVMLGRKPVDVADMAEDFRSEDDAHPGQVGKRGSAGVDGISHLMFVVFDGAIEAAQVGKEVSGEVSPATVSGGDWPDPSKKLGGLFGGEVDQGASGNQIAQQDVEPIEQPGALIDEVVAAFGQQPQDRGLVFGAHLAQIWPEQRDVRDMKCVCGVGLSAPPVASIRARAESVEGTSTTCSPSAASC